MSGTLYLCAAGNAEGIRLALEVNEATRRWDRIVLVDDDPAKLGLEIMGVAVVGSFAALADHQPGDEAVNMVARTTRGRAGARARIEGFGIPLASLVHPAVNLRGATLGRAVTLYEGCVISALATVHDHAIVFTGAVLGHGATLGEGAVLAPGAVVNARVRVGARAYIGSNAAVMPDLAVGEDATVSACSAVVGDVPAGRTALGVPAEVMGAASASHDTQRPPRPDDPALLEDLQTAFARVLDQSNIGADTGFFDAGGTSKHALLLHAALRDDLRDDLGAALTIVDIFRFPSPRQLAAHLFGRGGQAARPTRAELRRRRSAPA